MSNQTINVNGNDIMGIDHGKDLFHRNNNNTHNNNRKD
jgi:hypothetical protein